MGPLESKYCSRLPAIRVIQTRFMSSFMRKSTEIPILKNEKHQWSYGSTNASAANSKSNPFERKLSYLRVSTNGNRSLPIQNRQLTYPKAVIFVFLSKFFEAFAANGVRSKCI